MVVAVAAPVRCRICHALGTTETPGIPWECEACRAGDQPDSAPPPGWCHVGRHVAFAVYGPTRWGGLCPEHLRRTCRIAVWPRGWP